MFTFAFTWNFFIRHCKLHWQSNESHFLCQALADQHLLTKKLAASPPCHFGCPTSAQKEIQGWNSENLLKCPKVDNYNINVCKSDAVQSTRFTQPDSVPSSIIFGKQKERILFKTDSNIQISLVFSKLNYSDPQNPQNQKME